ncbi:deoxynucleoside kinase-like isoform X2 [Thrips palmi]|uniref:Deoxynucleoside kinase-like isoform X2 n=1 Tax=Thrips palmi TaxID=161013 RepID=A0A6P8YKD2_THRPL|nr:deoxynucleoside kinase-like isoform X2 [Thrips palmi]
MMRFLPNTLMQMTNELRHFGARVVPTCSGKASLSKMSKGNSKPFTIFVEGNIGSGKTTFLKHFAALDNVVTLAEPVDRWREVRGENFLDLMYSDPSRWGITFQTYVQLTMLDLHTKPVERPIKMMERSIHSARYCFVENLHSSGLMPNPDFIALDEWFNWILKNHDVAGNLIIYLRTTPEVVHKRMLSRARTEESCVPLDYLQKLHQFHEDWLYHRKSFNCPAPVLVIDADKDLEMMAADFLTCEAKISDAVANLGKQRNVSSPSKMNLSSPIKVPSLS